MDYSSFTNGSLTMMYEAVRAALVTDDVAEEHGKDPPFKIRTTSAWKKHVADLESEPLKRGVGFKLIVWDSTVD